MEALNKAIESDQEKSLLKIFDKKNPLSASDLMKKPYLTHRSTFRKNYLHPALNKGFIEMTFPDKPNNRLQKYRITPKGLEFKRNYKLN